MDGFIASSEDRNLFLFCGNNKSRRNINLLAAFLIAIGIWKMETVARHLAAKRPRGQSQSLLKFLDKTSTDFNEFELNTETLSIWSPFPSRVRTGLEGELTK